MTSSYILYDDLKIVFIFYDENFSFVFRQVINTFRL